MPDAARSRSIRVGPLIDSNVHLWDQQVNPVFWLTDRTIVRDMLGNYDSLPDTYTLADHLNATASFDVRGVVWSDAGAADPVAAADWVATQDTTGRVIGLVGLAAPATPGFEEIITALRENPLVTSVRLRLATSFGADAPAGEDHLDDALTVLDDQALVATLEATAD